MADLISREALIAEINRIGGHWLSGWDTAGVLSLASRIPAVDAVEVVRCAQCEHGIWDEEGLWMCVFTADYDEELGVYHGFIQHNTADYYCADGKRREENESNA